MVLVPFVLKPSPPLSKEIVMVSLFAASANVAMNRLTTKS